MASWRWLLVLGKEVLMHSARTLTLHWTCRYCWSIVLFVVICLQSGTAGAFLCTRCIGEPGGVEPNIEVVKSVDVASGWGGIKLLRAAAESMLMLAAAERRDKIEFVRRADASIENLRGAGAWYALTLSLVKQQGASGTNIHVYSAEQFRSRM